MKTILKSITTSLLLIAVIGGALLFASCSRSDSVQTKTLYTCGMHPQVIQDHPGNCPICGMKLTPIRKSGAATATGKRKVKYYKSTMNPGEIKQKPGKDSMGMDMVPVYEDEATSDTSVISVDPVTRQNMGIRTAEVVRGPLRRTIRTVANVGYDETTLVDVTTKFKGWIEKLYVNSTGQLANPGDPLFEIYSPELYSAQVEYVLALDQSSTNDPGAASLRETARTKLKFFDISDAQIAELEKTRQPKKTLVINAPAAGFVTEKMIVEGQMVEAGMKLYRLADIGIVWVYAQVYEQDLPYIQLGQEATMTLSYLPDRRFRGRVTYVYPTIDEKTRTARVRMEFHNPGYFLKPGMFATVEMVADIAPSALLVPDSAVLRSGERNTVFVALPEGKFEPRTVTLGLTAEDHQDQVLSGLREGERIVTSGQFMLDSESQLREAIQKMIEPGKSSAMANMTEAGETNQSTNALLTAELETNAVVWVCPMPEHVSIEYDHPGKCPICGMALVPVTRSMLEKIQPGGKVLYYTCPMPEHSDVHSDKPGKCPHCGMTLIPVMEKPAAVEPQPAASIQKSDTTPITLYTCPMVSDNYVSDKPGKCPKCEMDLVPTSSVPFGKAMEEKWKAEHQH
jgi:membrane fusion protein, copper/silver efflux system